MVIVNKVTTIFDKMFELDKNQHSVSELLTPTLNYRQKTINIYNNDIGNFKPEEIQSRSMNHKIINRRKQNIYETIVNCNKTKQSRDEDNDDKYKRLFLSRIEPSESDPEDETIDDMLKSIVKQTKKINRDINDIDANSKIHWASFYTTPSVINEMANNDSKLETIINKIVNTDLLVKVNKLLKRLKHMDKNQKEIYKEWEKMEQAIDGTSSSNPNPSSISDEVESESESESESDLEPESEPEPEPESEPETDPKSEPKSEPEPARTNPFESNQPPPIVDTRLTPPAAEAQVPLMNKPRKENNHEAPPGSLAALMEKLMNGERI
jgi:hypothetical protein